MQQLEQRSTRHRWVAISAAFAAFALFAAALVAPVPAAQAAPTVPFDQRFQTNANGALLSIGNTLLQCPASSSCTNAQNGATDDNNDFNMQYLDADSDSGTFNSSSSSLTLPEGASVLFAGLYWGARLDRGTNGQAASGSRSQIKFKAPGDTAYRTLQSGAEFGPNPSSNNAYQEFRDVTDIVQTTGNGAYWGADVSAGTGKDRYAGWALTVAYSAPGLPLRNLTVFDGFNVVQGGRPQTVTVRDFLAPPSGTVDTQLTMVAYEGDLSQTGDSTKLNRTQLATSLSPGSNFFNSSNDLNGTSVPASSRIPEYRNMLGFDVKNLGASGAIGNSDTEATFTFSSDGDVYYPGVVGLAINLYAPDFTTSSKSVVNLNGNTPARPGDVLQYTVSHPNTGQDDAVNAVSTDAIPPNTTYVAGSMRYTAAPGQASIALTDAVDGDAGDVTDNLVTVRVGSGTDSRIAIGDAPAYSFRVKVNEAAAGTTVTNIAHLGYTTDTTGTDATYTTNPASVPVAEVADVQIRKELSPDQVAAGGEVTATLLVTNRGPSEATDVVVSDPIPAGWNNVQASSEQGSCTITHGTVVCDLGELADDAEVTITLTGTTDPGSSATALSNVATVTASTFDPAPANNVSGDAVTLTRSADLVVAKSVAAGPYIPGGPVSWTVNVTNNGPSDAFGLVISDFLQGSNLATITGVSGAPGCVTPGSSGVVCSIPTLAAGDSVSLAVTGLLASQLVAGDTVQNDATVTASTPDPNVANNSDSATLTVDAPSSDIRVTKTGPATAAAGKSITWTITASNWGPSAASGVRVTDAAPAGVTLTSANTTRGTCSITSNALDCAIGSLQSAGTANDGTLQPGAAAVIRLTGTIDASFEGELVNTASATSSSDDPDLSNNEASASTLVSLAYDLSVTKTANRRTIPAEPTPVNYTITVTNHGPSAATGVVVRDLVPLSLIFDDATMPGGVSCDTSQAATPQAAPNQAQGLVTCALPNTVQPGEVIEIAVNMHADQAITATDPILQIAIVDGPADTNPSNNQSTWTLAGDPFADLALAKSAPENVFAGGTFDYQLAITNLNTPDPGQVDLDAIAPVVFDRLPDGVSFAGNASVTIQGDNEVPLSVACSVSSVDVQLLECRLSDNLTAGVTATIRVSVTLSPDTEPGTELVNSADVETGDMVNNPDVNLANNHAQATSSVFAIADPYVENMSITPLDSAQTGAGSQWKVAFTIGNHGPSTAQNVSLRNLIDPDARLIDTSSLPPACSVVNTELVCDLGDLRPSDTPASPDDAPQLISFTFALAGNVAPGSYEGSTHISSTTLDSSLANNDVSASFSVTEALTELEVTKRPLTDITTPEEAGAPVVHPAFVAGGPFSYEITVGVAGGANHASARNVTVSDELPAGFTAQQVSVSQRGSSCTITPPVDPNAAGSAIECELGTLAGPLGEQALPPVVLTINGVLDPDANNILGGDKWAEQVPNTVIAETTTALQSGDEDTRATAFVDVAEIADLRVVKTPDSSVVHAGGTIGYTLTAVNTGPSGVEHGVISDSLPVGFSLSEDQPECVAPQTTPEFDETAALPWVADGPGEEFACRIGALAANTTRSIHVVIDVDQTIDPGNYTNTAVIGSLANEGDDSNNTATADVAVDRLIDLAIAASTSTTTPAAGQDVVFSGFAVNNGPSSAVNTRGETTFPAGFVPVSVDVPFNTCTWNRDPLPDPATASWENFQYVLRCEPAVPGGQWESGGSATNVVVMHIPADTPAASYTASSTIESDTPEQDMSNNRAELTLVVQHVSDLKLEKTLVEPIPMQAGREATWELTVTNLGTSIADEVLLSDTVPEGLTFVSAENEQGTACTIVDTGDDRSIVKCPLGSLGVGDTATAHVTFKLANTIPLTLLCNTALVGSGSLDPNANDNSAAACGLVVEPPATDVAVTLNPDTQTLTPGQRAEVTVTVTNHGPNLATEVVVAFDASEGLTGISVLPGDAAVQAAATVVCDGTPLSCPIGALQSGDTVTFRLGGVATGASGEQLSLTGTVTHGEPDTNAVNDQDTALVLLSVPGGGGLPNTGGATIPGWLLACTLLALLSGAGLVGLQRRSERRRFAGSDR